MRRLNRPGSEGGTQTLLTVRVPCLVLVKVQVTVSPGSRSMFAVWPLTVVPLSGSLQMRLVNTHPAGGPDSVTVLAPPATLLKAWLPVPLEVVMLKLDGKPLVA